MKEQEEETSLYDIFYPLTSKKAIVYIFIIGFIVYFNVLFNGFVWDDDWQIINNAVVHSLANFPLFFIGGTFNSGGAMTLAGDFYRPLMSLYFSTIYTFFGPSAFIFHLVQVILYILNTVLVFVFFR